jgi:hypothetical protein
VRKECGAERSGAEEVEAMRMRRDGSGSESEKLRR